MQEQVLYPLETEVTMVTSFQDADPMGVIYHGNFFRYFEEARRVLMEKIEYSYRDMQASGYMLNHRHPREVCKGNPIQP